MSFDGLNDLRRGFGEERIQFVLAATIQSSDWGGRYSAANKDWANLIPVPKDTHVNRDYTLSHTHPGLVDLFATHWRKEISKDHEEFYKKRFDTKDHSAEAPEKSPSRSDGTER